MKRTQSSNFHTLHTDLTTRLLIFFLLCRCIDDVYCRVCRSPIISLPHSLHQGVYGDLIPTNRGLYQVCWGRISSFEVGNGISWLLGKFNVDKREKGINIINYIILRLLSGKEREGTDIFGK